MHMLANFLGTALAVLAAAELVPGFYVDGFVTALIVAVLLGIIGITIKPVLLLLTLPINLLTLGLFSFVLNAGILLALTFVVGGFSISGFLPALIAGFVISVIQWIVHKIT
jgi:putative membrane protein